MVEKKINALVIVGIRTNSVFMNEYLKHFTADKIYVNNLVTLHRSPISKSKI